jgi:UMF1 family MFS transporter
MQKNNMKIINAWCMFDWANSVYALVISSTIFPVYYNSATRSAFQGNEVVFMGIPIENTVLYSYSLAFAFLVVAALSPLLSGIADYSGLKKRFMMLFTYLGAGGCMALYFFEGINIEYGILASVLACIGYAGGLVFYNSYLPEITSRKDMDKVSARGYAMGYMGSVLLLVANLAMVSYPHYFGLANADQAARVSFLTVGIWWLGFAQITFWILPASKRPVRTGNMLSKGYRELRWVYRLLQKMPMTKRYLLSFFFFSTGVQTIMLLAATFGEKEIAMAAEKLILTVLIIQLIAIPGAYLFAYIAQRKDNRYAIMSMLLIWIMVCLAAYIIDNEYEFYILAAVVGLIMGGIQSMARSTYAKLIPKDTRDNTSFFSFYDVLEKLSVVTGTFCYGLVEQLTGDMRNSALLLSVFFLLGLFILQFVQIPRHRQLIHQIDTDLYEQRSRENAGEAA